MSEPITLYRGDETVTVFAPSVALDLQAHGWTTEPNGGIWANEVEPDDEDVPFSFREVEQDEPEPKPAKRGRPRKAQK